MHASRGCSSFLKAVNDLGFQRSGADSLLGKRSLGVVLGLAEPTSPEGAAVAYGFSRPRRHVRPSGAADSGVVAHFRSTVSVCVFVCHG